MKIDKVICLTVMFLAALNLCMPLFGLSEEKAGILPGAKEGDVIRINIDLNGERKLQAAVDQGHQPWRYEPNMVAYSVVAEDKIVSYEHGCTIVYERASQAKVRCEGTFRYFIELKRLVRPDGIWTATSITVDREITGVSP